MQLARKYSGLPSQAADNMRDLYSLFSQNHFALSIGKYVKPEEGDPMKKIGLRGTAGQVGLAGVLGYGTGTAIRNMYMQTETGQKFDNWGGEKIAQTLAFFGNDEAQAALDAQAKYDEMIKQQQQANQQNAQVIRELQKLPSAIGKSLNITIPSFNQLLNQAPQQSIVGDRQGVVPFLLQKP